jgi:hypothetical protein
MKKLLFLLFLLSAAGCIHHSYHARQEMIDYMPTASKLQKYDLSIGVLFVNEVDSEQTKYIEGDLATELSIWFVQFLKDTGNFTKVTNLNLRKDQDVDVILTAVLKALMVNDPGVSNTSSTMGVFYGVVPVVEHYSSKKNIVGLASMRFKLTDPATGELIWDQQITESSTKTTTLAELSRASFAAISKTLSTLLSDSTMPDELNKMQARKSASKTTPPLLWAGSKELPPVRNKNIARRWAVVIGISRYQDSRIPALNYASADAKAFYRWLVAPDKGAFATSDVKLLVDEQATYLNIREALFDWLQQAIEEDMVLLYFAGHGTPASPDRPDNLFLLCHDSNYNKIETTGFPMWDVETALRRFIKAKKVVVVTDACHSGGIGQSFEINRRDIFKASRMTSSMQQLAKVSDTIAVITASDDKEFSQESEIWGDGHGVFTYYFIRGLEGEADYNKDTAVTLGELIPYVSEKVRRETANSQSPTVAGKFDPALAISGLSSNN